MSSWSCSTYSGKTIARSIAASASLVILSNSSPSDSSSTSDYNPSMTAPCTGKGRHRHLSNCCQCHFQRLSPDRIHPTTALTHVCCQLGHLTCVLNHPTSLGFINNRFKQLLTSKIASRRLTPRKMASLFWC